MFETPILFLVFNRPFTTKKVFEQIKRIKPAYLYIAADGPRKDRTGENIICADVKKFLLSNIDWPCELKTLWRDENLGCGIAVSLAITWFFEHVDQGIILEDDCLPNQSFFYFCESMLRRFENDSHIMHISGNNFQLSKIGSECYYLTKIPHIWGWATWKRAWNNYDFRLLAFDEKIKKKYFCNNPIDNYWHAIFSNTKNNLHTWDYQWVYTIFKNEGLCIAPQYNLVSNIGFSDESTHVNNEGDYLSNLKAYEMPYFVSDTGNCNYEINNDINEQLFFKWIIPEKDNNPGISGLQALKILKLKLLKRFGICKFKGEV